MGQAERGLELERVIASATDKPHVILLWGHPDPDAIGSAMAHKRLCEDSRTMLIRAPDDRARKLFALTGLDNVFTVEKA